MAKAIMVSVNLPFPGFYESWLSGELDSTEERFAENEADYRQDEDGIPEELRLEQSDFQEILFDTMNYQGAHQYLASQYVATAAHMLTEIFEFPVKLEFEEMTSPREYNFTTDRVFAKVKLATMRKLFAMHKADKFKTLARVIEERHSSRSGFISFYSNDLDSWLEKPLADWDENEFGSLIIAAIELQSDRDDESFEFRTVMQMCEYGSDFDDALDKFNDWPKFERLVEEKRLELAADLDPEIAAELAKRTPRCKETPDLFMGRAG